MQRKETPTDPFLNLLANGLSRCKFVYGSPRAQEMTPVTDSVNATPGNYAVTNQSVSFKSCYCYCYKILTTTSKWLKSRPKPQRYTTSSGPFQCLKRETPILSSALTGRISKHFKKNDFAAVRRRYSSSMRELLVMQAVLLIGVKTTTWYGH